MTSAGDKQDKRGMRLAALMVGHSGSSPSEGTTSTVVSSRWTMCYEGQPNEQTVIVATSVDLVRRCMVIAGLFACHFFKRKNKRQKRKRQNSPPSPPLLHLSRHPSRATPLSPAKWVTLCPLEPACLGSNPSSATYQLGGQVSEPQFPHL